VLISACADLPSWPSGSLPCACYSYSTAIYVVALMSYARANSHLNGQVGLSLVVAVALLIPACAALILPHSVGVCLGMSLSGVLSSDKERCGWLLLLSAFSASASGCACVRLLRSSVRSVWLVCSLASPSPSPSPSLSSLSELLA
jgi:hypothetical protein